MSCRNSSCAQFQHSRYHLIGLGITSGASVFVCLVALTLVLALKLYKMFVYRLSLYQVLGAIGNGTFLIMDLAFEKYYGTGPVSFNRLCLATAYLTQFSLLAKLFFTIWLTFHLFCFAVYHKNMKRLEVLYVTTAILIPAVIAVVPFLTHTYGLAKGWCWIINVNDTACPPVPIPVGIIEQFATWYGPALLVFIIESSLMTILMVTLGCRAYRSSEGASGDPLLAGRSVHKKALNQMLPLMIYPLAFGVLIVPPMVNRVLDAVEGKESPVRCKLDVVFIPLLFLAAGATLIVHVCLLLRSKSGKRSSRAPTLDDAGMETVRVPTTRCSTFYVPPMESDVDSDYGSCRQIN